MTRLSRFAVVLFMFGLAGFAPRAPGQEIAPTAAPPAPGRRDPAAALTKLQERIAEILRGERTPGAGIAIIRRDGPEWIGGVGFSDAASRRPATGETVFRTGSVSKMFAALSLLKLEQEGRLTLQDPLRSRAPDLAFTNRWESTDPVRLVHLVEHTTGWDDLAMSEYVVDRMPEATLREALEYRPGTRTSRWRPGTRYSYCNGGAGAVAAVVEHTTGQRYEDYVAQTWFGPLGMRTAGYFDTPELRQRLTTLYGWDEQRVVPYVHILLRPPGAVNASAADLARLVEFLLHRGTIDGKSLLPTAAIARMERPATTFAARAGVAAGYGLANYTTQADGWVWHGHNGAIVGGVTELAYAPDLGVGYVVLLNSGNGRVLQQVCRLVRAHLTVGAAQPTPAPAQPVAPELARAFAGWYAPITPRNEISRFADRITRLQRVTFDATGYRTKPLFGSGRTEFLCTGGRLFRRTTEVLPSVALVSEPGEGRLIQPGGGPTFRRVPTGLVAVELAMVAAAAFFALSSFVVAPVWLALRAYRRRGFADGWLAVLPALAAVTLVLFPPVVFSALRDPINRLGAVGPWSLGLFAITTAFPLLAVAGLVLALRRRHAARQAVWWHALAASIAFSVLAAYAASGGVAGWRTWM
jgi:CubicO group peptidase (beta-lactamase class C family)